MGNEEVDRRFESEKEKKGERSHEEEKEEKSNMGWTESDVKVIVSEGLTIGVVEATAVEKEVEDPYETLANAV